jgi:hypothetical protein
MNGQVPLRSILVAVSVVAVIASSVVMPAQASPWALGNGYPSAEHRPGRQPAIGETVAEQPAADPLAPFERLIGGQWHFDGSYSEFEWGLGRQSVTTRSYFIIEGEPKLVSEGFWFWHPGEKQIKGTFTAIDMPVVLFNYTVRFEDNKMVADLVAFDAEGNETSYVETWEFTDDTHYEWKLLSETPDGLVEVMGGTYERRE